MLSGTHRTLFLFLFLFVCFVKTTSKVYIIPIDEYLVSSCEHHRIMHMTTELLFTDDEMPSFDHVGLL